MRPDGLLVLIRHDSQLAAQFLPARPTETLEAHLFLLPWTLGFLVLTIGPILASLGLSFTDWQVGLGLKFIGFQNFVTMFTEDD